LKDFIRMAFEYLGLNWKNHIVLDHELIRPTDISIGLANPLKAKKFLKWEAKIGIEEIIKLMIEDEIGL
jgi:GDPmannose 4,6-dehydratase